MFTARTGRVLATLGLSLLLSGVGLAQQPRGFGFGGGGGGLFLLSRPEVQTELKMTDAQKSQVQETMAKQRESGQARGQQFQNASPEERAKLMAEIQAEQTKAVNAILNADQQKRFKEISLQQQGARGLAMNPALADELKLTAEQKTQIQSIMQQSREASQGLFQQGGDRQAAMEKIQAINKESDAKIMALLTDAQKAQWTTMIGVPFNLPPGRPGGR
jgi:Spy/CpxP family protein refolding chaperone